MRILGVDPGLNITGYAVIETKNNNFGIIEAGIIKTNSKNKIQDRLKKIHKGLITLVKETNPEVIVLEKLYAHWRHPTTSYILGQARGVVCLVSAQMKLPLIEYAATRVKKAIVGQGHAGKYQIQGMMQHVFGLKEPIKISDVSDALSLALAYFYISRIKPR